jgi:hypothetical protein
MKRLMSHYSRANVADNHLLDLVGLDQSAEALLLDASIIGHDREAADFGVATCRECLDKCVGDTEAISRGGKVAPITSFQL